MPTFARYLLFQIPQWFLLALCLWLVIQRVDVPRWWAPAILIVWMLKDLAVYPLTRSAYEKAAKTGRERLVGHEGTAYEEIAPRGYIKIHGEFWKAQARNAYRPIPKGSPVSVTAVREETLIIEPGGSMQSHSGN
jgi:membrane protein implicated in regulation of membrane protease activity